jgi:hypothetical protein
MPNPYMVDLPERVAPRGRGALQAVGFPVVNLVKAFPVRGSLSPSPAAEHRHAKIELYRAFHLEKVAEKADITMPELAAELAAATCEKANPASLFTLAYPHRLSLQNVWLAPFARGFVEIGG